MPKKNKSKNNKVKNNKKNSIKFSYKNLIYSRISYYTILLILCFYLYILNLSTAPIEINLYFTKFTIYPINETYIKNEAMKLQYGVSKLQELKIPDEVKNYAINYYNSILKEVENVDDYNIIDRQRLSVKMQKALDSCEYIIRNEEK